MSENQVTYPVATMCRLLGLSPSGYYVWLTRGPSDRDLADEWLLAQIRAIHERSDETYGAPRIHEEFKAQGVRVGKKRIARLLRQAGIQTSPGAAASGPRRRTPPLDGTKTW